VVLVPGNHDYYRADSWQPICDCWGPYIGLGPETAGTSPSALFPRVRELEADGVIVTVLGLCSAYPAPLLLADGRLGTAQLDRLERLLASAKGFCCLLLHHPPLPGMTAWRKALREAAPLASLLERHRPGLVLHGHVHRNQVGPLIGGGRVFATASASSNRPDAPASYRVFDIAREPDGWQVHMRLKGVTSKGQMAVLDEARWRVAVNETPSLI
jgi:3',5'-cyclic AMP phosphodiesterase CpdA